MTAPLIWPAVTSIVLLPLPRLMAMPLPPTMVPALRTVMLASAPRTPGIVRARYRSAGLIDEGSGGARLEENPSCEVG
jgi:hypothetical protein